MNAKRISFVLTIAILFTLSGCMSPEELSQPIESPSVLLPTSAADFPQLPPQIPGVSGASGWPAYIPADIPPLEGTITNVMEAPGSHVRLFFEGVSEQQLEAYLGQLQSLGYTLEYVVYVPEGVPNDSDERLKAGDYDAVRIARGAYDMTIEFGEELLTYDISTAAFSGSVQDSAGLEWPAGLASLVPQPEHCPINHMLPPQPDWVMITCRPADDAVLDDYLHLLQGAGFQPVETSLESVAPLHTYRLDALEVSLQQTSPTILSIEIKLVDQSLAAWPVSLEGLVPAPENCPVTSVIQPGGSDTIINCARQNDEVVANYLTVLSANGFVETGRMELKAGDPVSITLEKDNLEVCLMIATTDDLLIMVVQKP